MRLAPRYPTAGQPRRLARLGVGTSPWSPARLGSSLLGWWDAENAGSITQSGGTVSAWNDAVAGYPAAQATGSQRPAYSATSFNGRPGLTFDGVDDCLELASVPFPTGASAVEIWALVSQLALVADATNRCAFAYGDATNTSRRLERTVPSGVNRAGARIGSGAANTLITNDNIDFSGRNVVRAIIGATTTEVDVNGNAGTGAAVTPSTDIVKTRIGASASGTAAAFYSGTVSAILVTNPLSAASAAQLLNYLKTRGGIA